MLRERTFVCRRHYRSRALPSLRFEAKGNEKKKIHVKLRDRRRNNYKCIVFKEIVFVYQYQ
jgi:hypothetical protein